MADERRRATKPGMGSVVLESGMVPRGETESSEPPPPSGAKTGVDCPTAEEDRRALGTRDTVRALEAQAPPSSRSGALGPPTNRRQTLGAFSSPRERPIPRADPPELALHVRPRLKPATNVAEAPLDAREAFLLSLVDGRSSVQDILDTAAMPCAEAMATLQRLVRLGLIVL